MNKLTWITGALAALMVILAVLGAVCGAVSQIAVDDRFYGEMSRMAVADTIDTGDAVDITGQMTAYIGLASDEQDVFAGEMAAFMRGETDAQPEILNEKERAHMLDVRKLVRLAQTVSKGCMSVAAGIAVVIAWTGARQKRRGAFAGMAAGALLTAAAAFGAYELLSAQGFGPLFIRFHEVFFTNDLWLMNPETDILIRMMPQLLFERAGLEAVRLALRSFVITWILLMAVYFIVGGMIRRQLAEREQTK